MPQRIDQLLAGFAEGDALYYYDVQRDDTATLVVSWRQEHP